MGCATSKFKCSAQQSSSKNGGKVHNWHLIKPFNLNIPFPAPFCETIRSVLKQYFIAFRNIDLNIDINMG